MFGWRRRTPEAEKFWSRLDEELAPLFDFWVQEFYSTAPRAEVESDSDMGYPA